jgi:F-type H+-transporting ATPase subunit delta
MTNRSAAGRYARALLDVARRESNPEAVGRELDSFLSLVRGNDGLQKSLTNPAIPVQKKSSLVQVLAERAGLSDVLRKLLLLLAERDRLVLLPDLVEEYRRRLLDHLNVVQAEVVTAVPLPPERLGAIEAVLARMTGRQVSMTTRVDASLIGGVVTRIGSVVYDGSVRRQLERMRETLAQAD